MRTSFIAAAVGCFGLGASPSLASTFLVTEVYRMDISAFVFDSNFWDQFPDRTDADDTVPIDHLSMTFELSYLTPVEDVLDYRDPVERFVVTDLALSTNNTANITQAETLTTADIVTQTARYNRGFGIDMRIGRDGPGRSGTHTLSLRVPNLASLAMGLIPQGATLELGIDSLMPFDSPDYLALNDTWRVERLSTRAEPAPIPAPASGELMLGGAAALGAGVVARRRRRAFTTRP